MHGSVHQGKAAALNRAVLHATGDVLLFADARQSFARKVVRELVANFADPAVGVASGELVLLDDQQAEANDGAGLYWRYEKKLRCMESAIHSVLGATGAVYAMRRGFSSRLSAGRSWTMSPFRCARSLPDTAPYSTPPRAPTTGRASPPRRNTAERCAP